MDPQSSASLRRPLNVDDALAYLDAVKAEFRGQLSEYHRFLDTMKHFRAGQQVPCSSAGAVHADFP